MEKPRPLRTLPIEGLPLRELIVEGNGKRAMFLAVATDGRKFQFGISDFSLQFNVRGAIDTEVRALDDLTLRVRYSAERMSLSRAQIDYPGTDESWERDVEAFRNGKLMSWAMSEATFELAGEPSSA